MPLALGDLALLLLYDPLVPRVEEVGEGDVEIPVEMVGVVDPVGRGEAGPQRILPAVALGFVLLDVDREGPRLHELGDPAHLLLDDRVDLVVRVLRLVFEAADLDEQLLAFPQAREELHQVLRRDDSDRLIRLRHDDRGDVMFRHELRGAVDVRIGTDRQRRIPHDSLHLEHDLLLAPGPLAVLLALLRPGEQVYDVLHPDDAFQMTVLVDDGHGALAEGPHDLVRVLNRVVRRRGHKVRGHVVRDAEVLDLDPLHSRTRRGGAAIAEARIITFFRGPHRDGAPSVDAVAAASDYHHRPSPSLRMTRS